MRRARVLRWLRLGTAGWLGVCLGATAPQPTHADDMGGEVTAVIGDVTTGSGRPLATRSQIADRERIALGEGGAASILLAEDALLELCERADVSLERDATNGRRRIYVSAGAIRVVVEPRGAPEHIEVYTPAAIATIVGTIVHVAVDGATGETTITSEENSVRVVSRDPDVPGDTVVAASEQIVMRPGAPPPQDPRRLRPDEVAQLVGCVVDFHGAASDVASQDRQIHSADRIANSEAEPKTDAATEERWGNSTWSPPPWQPAPERPKRAETPASPSPR